jgi:hypothetical protein
VRLVKMIRIVGGIIDNGLYFSETDHVSVLRRRKTQWTQVKNCHRKHKNEKETMCLPFHNLQPLLNLKLPLLIQELASSERRFRIRMYRYSRTIVARSIAFLPRCTGRLFSLSLCAKVIPVMRSISPRHHTIACEKPSRDVCN